MNYRMLAYILGYILRIQALFMLPGLAISLARRESSAVYGFLIAILLLLVVSAASFFLKPKERHFYARDGLVIVALVWIVMSVFGALPFFISREIPHFIDALFETVSGFTTTGASILTSVEAMPHGLLYWRSFTHWLGGMGVLVFLLAILPMAQGSGSSLHLMRAESPGPEVGKLAPKMRKTAVILYAIYCVMTVVQMGLLLLSGMPLFDSVCISFGTAGTGGFGVLNDSCVRYTFLQQNIIAVFMVLFGINFSIYYLLLLREFSRAFFNEELRAYLGIVTAATLLIGYNTLPFFNGDFGDALHHAFFQVASIMTTSGFATTDFNLWPEFSRTILVVLMVIGASAGSTGGGIKVSRGLLLLKNARQTIRRMINPREVNLVRMDQEVVGEDTLHGVNVYMTFYCLIGVVSLLVISKDNFSLESNITAVLSCLNNIGPGLGAVGPMENFSAYSGLSKLVLTMDMLFGRLEIFPMLTLLLPSVWRRASQRGKVSMV